VADAIDMTMLRIDNDAPEDLDDEAGRRVLHEGSKGKVV
jgi:hypothetical protein